MKTNMIVPKKLNVGYRERKDTYTGKLSYVIYYDEKNVLRKEKSWNSWRDNKIKNEEFDNVPTEGFVLNKHVGGYSSGWDHRNSYIRVYDPRGFEFEISVENLLYILENCNCIKGKGIEGKLVYAWDGSDLVLTPVDAPDYKDLQVYNATLFAVSKIYAKDLVVGRTYKTNKNDDYVYLGKFDKWSHESTFINEYGNSDTIRKNDGKHHFFGRSRVSRFSGKYTELLIVKSPPSKFISVVSEEISFELGEFLNNLEKSPKYAPVDPQKDEYVKYTNDEILKIMSKKGERRFHVTDKDLEGGFVKKDTYVFLNSTGHKKPLLDRLAYMNRDYRLGRIEMTVRELLEKCEFHYINRYSINGIKCHTTNYFEKDD